MDAAERRIRRDASARQRLNPDTGRPFRNYNELDLWQRNQRAKSLGYTSRSHKRYQAEQQRAGDIVSAMPRAFDNFLSGRAPTEKLKREFERAFGHGVGTESRRAAREVYFDSDYADEWDWEVWREEYSDTS